MFSRRDNAKAAAITYGSGQITVSDPSHASLKDRVLDTQQFTNGWLDHIYLPLLALDQLVQIVHSLNGLIPHLDLHTKFILQVHQQLHGVQGVDSQFGKGAFRLHCRNITAGTIGNNLSNCVKIHNNSLHFLQQMLLVGDHYTDIKFQTDASRVPKAFQTFKDLWSSYNNSENITQFRNVSLGLFLTFQRYPKIEIMPPVRFTYRGHTLN